MKCQNNETTVIVKSQKYHSEKKSKVRCWKVESTMISNQNKETSWFSSCVCDAMTLTGCRSKCVFSFTPVSVLEFWLYPPDRPSQITNQLLIIAHQVNDYDPTHNFWIGGERRRAIWLNVQNQLSREITPCPMTKPAIPGLQVSRSTYLRPSNFLFNLIDFEFYNMYWSTSVDHMCLCV